MTPLSATTPSPYCSLAQFLLRNDARRVGQLCLDIGQQAEGEAIKNGNGLPANSVVQECIDSASGELEAACLTGDRYEPSDLLVIVGTVSGKFMARLVADLGMWDLLGRRHAESAPTSRVKKAWDYLDRLREGKAIFGILEAAQAGIPEDDYLVESDIARQNLATYQAERYFGMRGNRRRSLP